MLFMKCAENQCVTDCGECKKSMKKRSHTILWKVQLNFKILTSAFLVQLQKEEKLREICYLKVECLSHIRYHGVLLWNEIAVDWLSVAMQFGACSCFSAGMRTRGLVRPPFMAKTTWFGIPDFCNVEEEWWDMVSMTMKCVTAMMYRWALGWQKSPWWKSPSRCCVVADHSQ